MPQKGKETNKRYSISWLASAFGKDRRKMTEALREVPPDGKGDGGKDGWTIKTAFNALVGSSSEDARLKAAKAQKAEIELAMLKGTLMAVEQHENTCTNAIGVLRMGLASIPSAVTRDPGQRRSIEDILDRILADTAAKFNETADSSAS